MYKEEYERGIRRKKCLEELDEYFKEISEEVERIEEGKADEKKVEEVVNRLIYKIEEEIEIEEDNRGDIDYVKYWKNVLKLVMKAREWIEVDKKEEWIETEREEEKSMEDSKLEKERTEFDKKEKGILHFSLSDEEIDDLSLF